MNDRLWFKGVGKITDPGLVDFIEIWDACTPAERVQFLHQHAPLLHDFEIEEHSGRDGRQLRRGVLIALAGLLEGTLKVHADKTE